MRRQEPRSPRAETEWGETVYGVHPVTELLERRAREVERVFVLLGRHARLGRLLRLAREHGVPISHVAAEVLATKAGRRAVHQGVAARVAARAYADADEICRQVAADPEGRLVLVDRVTDPRNLGAIVRTAAAAGVTGLLLAAEETVGLTPSAIKTAAGAAERIPIGRDQALGRRVEWLKKAGFTTVALDPRGRPLWGVPLHGRIAVVAGGEQGGAGEGVLRACEWRLAVPLAPGVESLNVAVALGVLLFEAARQRHARGPDLESPG